MRQKKTRHPRHQHAVLNLPSARPWIVLFWPISIRSARTVCALLVGLLSSSAARLPPAVRSEAGSPLTATLTRSYATTFGEHRRFQLPDGTTVDLNSDSLLTITFSSQVRWIDVKGEALFRVNHEDKRPFRVRSGRGVIEDVATAFDVYKKAHSTLVSVIEGSIKIYPRIAAASTDTGNETANTTRFRQGQQIQLPDSDDTLQVLPTLSAEALSRVIAWSEGRLKLECTLSEAIEELSRYHPEHFKLADEALGQTYIGLDIVNNVDDFLGGLKLEFNIEHKTARAQDGQKLFILSAGHAKGSTSRAAQP